MEDESKLIRELQDRLEGLLKRQEEFSKEIGELKKAIAALSAPKESPIIRPEEIASEPVREAAEPAAETGAKAAEPDLGEPVSEPPSPPEYGPLPRKLYRSQSKKILGGVASGLAEYLRINTALSRLAWVVLSVFFCIGPIVYLILWMAIPAAPWPEYAPVQEGAAPPAPIPAEPAPVAPPAPARVVREERTGPEPVPGSGPFNLEKYIGENLISKIGIVTLIIGVGLGVKYSIDNDLISPAIRIMLGYMVGLALVALSWKLKEAYGNFSAILLSGAMAIMYFITFAAHAFYDLLPQWAAFALMVLFTGATVMSAWTYNRQIIAHIGMVGAYGVPFLLDQGTGQAAVFFTYIAIINVGILFIALRKYWKPLYLFSFGLTWLIFLTWYATGYDYELHRTLSWVFLCLFYLVFYATFLIHKFLKKEVFNVPDVVLLLANSFIFYGIGYHLIQNSEAGASYLGLFTLMNAVPHALVSYVFYRYKVADKNILRLIAGLVVVFITLSIPVQLDGNWVTLLWIGEAALLFRIGRSKDVALYERLSYPLMALSFISLLQDWGQASQASHIYAEAGGATPFFNPVFLTSLLYTGALGAILHWYRKSPGVVLWRGRESMGQAIYSGLTAMLLLVIYASFALEIANYWNQMAAAARVRWQETESFGYTNDFVLFRTIWLLNYTFLFLALLGVVNIYKLRSRTLGIAHLLLGVLALFLFLSAGLLCLSDLRESYLFPDPYQENPAGAFHLGIRYVSFVFLALFLVVTLKVRSSAFMEPEVKVNNAVVEVILAIAAVWIITSELLHWLDLYGASNTYKLWVSILWGTCALTLVVLGIWKKKKHLRVGAITLFSLTLIKLFFYDIAHLNTLSKTIVFFILGVLLLVVSYLYNRFKNRITQEDR